MSTPVCLANAVADALGIDDVELPMTPSKVASWFAGEEPPPEWHPQEGEEPPPEWHPQEDEEPPPE